MARFREGSLDSPISFGKIERHGFACSWLAPAGDLGNLVLDGPKQSAQIEGTVHDRYFLQVQNEPRCGILELLFQFLDVLRLKMPNQTNRGRYAEQSCAQNSV